MKHFAQLPSEMDYLFEKTPVATTELSPYALGASIYCPLDAVDVLKRVQGLKRYGATSVILDLEDGINVENLLVAEKQLGLVLSYIQKQQESDKSENEPFYFVRVKSPKHLEILCEIFGKELDVLAGVSMPKFVAATRGLAQGEASGPRYLRALHRINQQLPGNKKLMAIPILEGPEIANPLLQERELHELMNLSRSYFDDILCFRVGATDVSGLYGVRRSKDFTIYQSQLLSAPLVNIVNTLSDNSQDCCKTVSAAVWEHFFNKERLFKPQLRESPFEAKNEIGLRHELLLADMDGLIREVELDKINGFVGKTVIHPSHIPLVNALYVVPYSEYQDALDVLSRETGVGTSENHDKMNESGPHRARAQKIIVRSKLFGVYAKGVSYIELFKATQEVIENIA